MTNNIKTDHGAVGDGVTDDRAAIQAALNIGGVVECPPGRYFIGGTGLQVQSDTTIVGTAETWFIRSGLLAGGMLEANSKNNIRIEDMGFEWTDPELFATNLFFDICSDVSIIDCRSVALAPFPNEVDTTITLHGILFKTSTNILIRGCTVDGMQVLVSGGTGVNGAQVLGNKFRNCRNFALSAIGPNSSGSVQNLVIADNIVENPEGDGGFFIGSDNQSSLASVVRNISITGNIVRGTWGANVPGGFLPRNGCGVFFRPGTLTENIDISNNILIGDNTVHTSIGIKIDGTTPVAVIKDLNVSKNQVKGFRAQYGILLHGGDVQRALIDGNMVQGTPGGGILVGRGSWKDLSFVNNISYTANGYGIEFQALDAPSISGSFDRLYCAGNRALEATNAGFVFTANTDTSISGLVLGCYSFDNNNEGVLEQGTGIFELRYINCDFRGNTGEAFDVSAISEQINCLPPLPDPPNPVPVRSPNSPPRRYKVAPR